MGKTTSEQKENPVSIICKNCDTEFNGNYCPNCGQSIGEYDKPFRFLIVDLAGNIFAFDTRLIKSLKALILKPGKFASDFIIGKRARYMPPFRLYVFISFMFFLLLSFNIDLDKINTGGLEDIDEIEENVKKDIEKGLDDVKELDSLYKNNPEIKAQVDTLKNLNKVIVGDIESMDEEDEEMKEKLQNFLDNPGLYITSLLKYVTWAMFILMPIYSMILLLFFHNSREYYIGHLVLGINQHSFYFLLFTLVLIIGMLMPENTSNYENYLLWLLPLYTIIGNKNFYKQSWGRIIIKTFFIHMLYFIVLLFAIAFIAYFWFRYEIM